MGMGSGLSAALFGRAKRAVLALLFGRPDEAFYVRQIVRAAGVGSGAVQRELEALERVGIVERRVDGRQVYYRANPSCPIFSELRAIVAKTAGIADVIRAALDPLRERVHTAFVYGSATRGALTAASDVDVLVIGDASFSDVSEAVHPVQEKLGREVNPSVFTASEWRERLHHGEHFATQVSEGDKLFLIGDESEFGRLAR